MNKENTVVLVAMTAWKDMTNLLMEELDEYGFYRADVREKFLEQCGLKLKDGKTVGDICVAVGRGLKDAMDDRSLAEKQIAEELRKICELAGNNVKEEQEENVMEKNAALNTAMCKIILMLNSTVESLEQRYEKMDNGKKEECLKHGIGYIDTVINIMAGSKVGSFSEPTIDPIYDSDGRCIAGVIHEARKFGIDMVGRNYEGLDAGSSNDRWESLKQLFAEHTIPALEGKQNASSANGKKACNCINEYKAKLVRQMQEKFADDADTFAKVMEVLYANEG